MDRLIPRLISLERMIKPRYWPFWRRQGDRVIGIMIFLLAVVVTLPIPLGNWLPAFSTALLGLALIERDGILFAVGTVVGIAALAVIAAVVGSATALIGTLWQCLHDLIAAPAAFQTSPAASAPRHCAICGTSLLNARASSHNKRRSRRSGNAEIHESAARPVGRAKDVLDLDLCIVLSENRFRFRAMQQEHEFMADLIVVYWRDIPAQVIVKKGRQNAKRELPLRFTEAIDMCAMRTGAGDTDAYLAEWRKADPVAGRRRPRGRGREGAGRLRCRLRPGSGWSLWSRPAGRDNV